MLQEGVTVKNKNPPGGGWSWAPRGALKKDYYSVEQWGGQDGQPILRSKKNGLDVCQRRKYARSNGGGGPRKAGKRLVTVILGIKQGKEFSLLYVARSEINRGKKKDSTGQYK